MRINGVNLSPFFSPLHFSECTEKYKERIVPLPQQLYVFSPSSHVPEPRLLIMEFIEIVTDRNRKQP